VPLFAAVTTLVFAFAEDTTAVRLAYEGSATCPAESDFFNSIRARTSHVRRAQGDEPALEVNVRVTRTERGFIGEVREIENQRVSSARTMDGATCKEVVEALSLTIALSVDPNAHAPIASTSPPAPAPAPASPAAPQSAPLAQPAAEQLELEVSIDAVLFQPLGAEPSAGAALSAAVSRRWQSSRFSAFELSLLFAKAGLLSTPRDYESDFEGLVLDACPVGFHTGAIDLAPCALAVGGVLGATGRNVAEPATVSRGFWSAGLDFKLSATIGHGFAFAGTLGAAAPLVERRFYEGDPGRLVAKTPLISPLLRLGLAYRF
jgi:hypothetical protein